MRDRLGRCPSPHPTLRRLAAVTIGGVTVGLAAAVAVGGHQGTALLSTLTTHVDPVLDGPVVHSGSRALRIVDEPQEAAPAPPPPAPPTVQHIVLAGTGPGVPVLMYHYIRDNPVAADLLGFRLSVRPADFSAQLDLLAAAGYTTVAPQAVYDAVGGHAQLPPHPICITMDDGYADFATTAVPLLAAHHDTAVDYVVSGFLGRPGYMSADQVRALPQQGMVVGAHTVHHVGLDQVPLGVAAMEITQSRHDLEALLGRPVTDFAYPAGRFNAAVEHLAAGAGFHGAVTTQEGVTGAGGDLYALHRIRVSGGEDLGAFAARLGISVADVPVPAPAPAPAPAAPTTQAAAPAPAAPPARHEHTLPPVVTGLSAVQPVPSAPMAAAVEAGGALGEVPRRFLSASTIAR